LADMDQSELARQIGCTPGAISQILSGQTRRSKFLPEIAIVLGVSINWLLGEADEPNPPEWPRIPPRITTDEHKLLTIYRRLPKKDQAALKLLIARMAGEA
jgi:transcriptional regulator with XRE-family HTH domain